MGEAGRSDADDVRVTPARGWFRGEKASPEPVTGDRRVAAAENLEWTISKNTQETRFVLSNLPPIHHWSTAYCGARHLEHREQATSPQSLFNPLRRLQVAAVGEISSKFGDENTREYANPKMVPLAQNLSKIVKIQPRVTISDNDFLTDKEKCRRAPPSERMGPNSPSSPVYDPMEIVRDRIDPRELQILCRLLAFRTPCQRSKTQRHPLCPAPCFPAPSANLFGGCRSIGLDFVWSDVQEALEQEGMGDSAARSLP